MKRIITILICALSITGITAQTYSSEWRIHAAAGSTAFQFSSEVLAPEIANSKGGFGGNAGVDYTYFFSRYFAFSLGAEAAIYNNATTSPVSVNTETPIESPQGLPGNLFLRTQYDGIAETQTATFLQLPLMLRLQIPLSSKFFCYLAAGGKYGIPLTATYKQTINVLTQGYSDYFEQTLENMPKYGFEPRHDAHLSGKLELTRMFISSFETGFKWQNSLGNSFYISYFADSGLAAGVKLGFAFGSGYLRGAKPAPLWGY